MLYTMNSKLKLKSSAGNFGEVIKMIDDMVVLLGKQQTEDDKSKEFCEAEFDKAEDEEKAAATKLSQLDATLSENMDTVSSLMQEISDLKAGITELDHAVATATEQRKEEHAEYIEAIQMNEAAAGLVGKAKKRLQKFYNPSMALNQQPKADSSFIQTVSFVQVRTHDEDSSDVAPPPPPPETFGSGPPKKNEKSAGVMGMMDEIVNELKMDMKDMEYEEKTAQKDYGELMADSQTNRAADSKAIVDKEATKAELETKLMATKEARANEVDSLKNAKAVLSGANFGF